MAKTKNPDGKERWCAELSRAFTSPSWLTRRMRSNASSSGPWLTWQLQLGFWINKAQPTDLSHQTEVLVIQISPLQLWAWIICLFLKIIQSPSVAFKAISGRFVLLEWRCCLEPACPFPACDVHGAAGLMGCATCFPLALILPGTFPPHWSEISAHHSSFSRRA